jgi:hypothetical protein
VTLAASILGVKLQLHPVGLVSSDIARRSSSNSNNRTEVGGIATGRRRSPGYADHLIRRH